MNCEIIAVGSEITSGDVTNTNAAFLSGERENPFLSSRKERGSRKKQILNFYSALSFPTGSGVTFSFCSGPRISMNSSPVMVSFS